MYISEESLLLIASTSEFFSSFVTLFMCVHFFKIYTTATMKNLCFFSCLAQEKEREREREKLELRGARGIYVVYIGGKPIINCKNNLLTKNKNNNECMSHKTKTK
jgi:hypothetical protein